MHTVFHVFAVKCAINLQRAVTETLCPFCESPEGAVKKQPHTHTCTRLPVCQRGSFEDSRVACCRAARHVLLRRRVREDSAFTVRHRRRSSPSQGSSLSLFSLCFCLRVCLCFYHDISRLPGWLAASRICQHDCIMSQMVRRPCDSAANQSLCTVMS